MKRQYDIRSALIISVSILTLLPMITATVISLVMFHRETTERIRQENLKVAQTVSTAVELFIARPVVMLKQIKEEIDEECAPGLCDIASIARKKLDSDPLFESVLFIDSKGDLVGVAGDSAAPPKSGAPKQNFTGSELFKRLKINGQKAWSEPFVSLKTGESVILVAIPWRGGMISGTMNLSYLCKLVEPTKTSMNAYAFIVSPEGRLIAHPDRALVGEKEAFISIPQITAGFQGTTGTYNFKISGRSVIGSVLPFSHNEWVIVSVHDKKNAYASLYRMESFLGLLILAVLSGALFFSFRRVNMITAPIRALSESTHRIASGELVPEPFESSSYREIHELYENFRTMAEAVAERERDLQERNEELAVTDEELRSQVEEYLKTQDALVSEKVKLESVLASMGEGLSIHDRDYKVILQNQAHKDLVGEALGRYCYETYDHNNTCPDCPLKLAYEDGGKHLVLRQIERGGGTVFIEITASPLRNSADEIIGGVEIVRDVTSRVMADQEIRRLNQELEVRVTQRTAELETANRELESFSYSVSHDLRAPLRHISSFSSILESDHSESLDRDGKYYLSRILAGCSKMGMLIDDLLELSQVSRSELRREHVNLSRIVNMIAASMIEREPERNVCFNIEESPVVNGDERLLEVMLNNLLSNAWKYTSQKTEAVIEFGCKTIDSSSVYFIKDNGAGFDKNYAEKLFAPFHRLHGAEFEGTGVGLAIVQRIIHRHGGTIWADAVVGEGATFYFTLKS